MMSRRSSPGVGVFVALSLMVGHLIVVRPATADEPKPARPAKPTIALLAGGADNDLKVLRAVLEKNAQIKFKADDLKYADFGREGGKFTSFLSIEVADLGKTDIGAIAKAVAAADTSKKETCPPRLFVIIRYLPGSAKNEQFREALAKVKGVQPEKSWVGDANLWIQVDDSGEGKLSEITKAIHGAGIKIKDPIIDIKD